MFEENLTGKIEKMRSEYEDKGLNTDAVNSVFENQANKISSEKSENQKRKDTLNSIIEASGVDYRNADFSKKALNDYQEIINYVQNARKNHVEPQYIEKQVSEKVKALQAEYMTGVKKQLETVKANKATFAENFKPKNPYENPFVEMLKRQDFNANLDALSDNGLSAYIKELDLSKLSDYELNRLIAKTKDTDKALHNELVANKISQARTTPYKNTTTWENLTSSENMLTGIIEKNNQANLTRFQVMGENGEIDSLPITANGILEKSVQNDSSKNN